MAKTKKKLFNWHFWHTKKKFQVVICASSYAGAKARLKTVLGESMAQEFVFEFGDSF